MGRLGNIKINVGSKTIETQDEKRWNELTDAVMSGKVIPVIGSDFLLDSIEEGEDSNLHHQLINLLAEECNVKSSPKTFSQLVYDKDFKYATESNDEAIYGLLAAILDQIQEQQGQQSEEENQIKPSELLIKLLKLRKFPFVITTSFTPMVEMAMKQVWPDKEIRVLQFSNDPQKDLLAGVGDIENEYDLDKPTVYYMFGKYSINPHRYVVTDMDMMDFCKTWLAGGNSIPRVLSEVLKNRYLLVLGNNYSDWLFRFIWYSLRNYSSDLMKSSTSLMVNDKIEPTLKEFLDRLQTFIEKDPKHVIEELERRVTAREKVQSATNVTRRYDTDIFLSYSRRDKDVVQKIYKALSNVGLRVWYDSNDIPGASDWKQTFLKGVKHTRIFIPILSTNIEKEYREPHEYRDEWATAASIASKMGGCDFIWPLAEQGFNFYNDNNKLPEEFQKKNASWYSIADDFVQFSQEVKVKIDQLKVEERRISHE